jgi:hypothetical protein
VCTDVAVADCVVDVAGVTVEIIDVIHGVVVTRTNFLIFRCSFLSLSQILLVS